MRASWLLVVFLMACGGGASGPAGSGTGPAAPSGPVEEPTASEPIGLDVAQGEPSLSEAVPDLPAGALQPADLYAACRDRVEGPGTDGECSTDADCARAGCSSEVCVPVSAASDIMTSCEVRPCFAVLQSCGCVQGQCSWSLNDAVPAPAGPPIPLPGAH